MSRSRLDVGFETPRAGFSIRRLPSLGIEPLEADLEADFHRDIDVNIQCTSSYSESIL